MKMVSLKLTPYQAKLLWGVVDGAVDAGACHDGSGNSNRETDGLHRISVKLLSQRDAWKDAK